MFPSPKNKNKIDKYFQGSFFTILISFLFFIVRYAFGQVWNNILSIPWGRYKNYLARTKENWYQYEELFFRSLVVLIFLIWMAMTNPYLELSYYRGNNFPIKEPLPANDKKILKKAMSPGIFSIPEVKEPVINKEKEEKMNESESEEQGDISNDILPPEELTCQAMKEDKQCEERCSKEWEPKEEVKKVLPKKSAAPARKKISAPMPADFKRVGGRLVCSKSHDKPGKSKKGKGKHMDMECCLDPDEYPNPHCYYPLEKYGKYLGKK